jgi:predicted Zn-dependent protease
MKTFANFYFNKTSEAAKEAVSTLIITETQLQTLLDELDNNEELVIEREKFNSDWGYGFKYLLKNCEKLVCENRFKDEVDNNDARLTFYTEHTKTMILELLHKQGELYGF